MSGADPQWPGTEAVLRNTLANERAFCDAAEAKLAAVREACESVKGTYQHPDQLEAAMCKAFEKIAGIVNAAEGGELLATVQVDTLPDGTRTEQTLTPPAVLVDGQWIPRERIISPEERAILDVVKAARITPGSWCFTLDECDQLARAELARRKSKEEGVAATVRRGGSAGIGRDD